MRHLPGQAALRVWVFTHRLITVLLAILLLGGAGIGMLAWRLAQGPLEITWLARQLEAAINAPVDDPANGRGGDAARLSIGSAALVWEGFRDGVDRPLDIRLTDINATDASGVIVFAVPSADISLSIRALITGQIAPRAIELTRPHLRLHRAADGAVTIDLASLMEAGSGDGTDGATAGPGPGTANTVLAELARSPTTDAVSFRDDRLSQLRRIVVRDASVTVIDRQIGATWRAGQVDITMDRRDQGGVVASAYLGLTLGGETARLSLSGTLSPGGNGAGTFNAALTPISPAALARAAPALAPLSMLDSAVVLAGRLDLGPAFTVRGGALLARVSRGQIKLGTGDVTVLGGGLDLQMDVVGVRLNGLNVKVQPRPQGPITTLTAEGLLTRGERQQANVTLALDRFDFIDLPALWPESAAPGAQRWVARNVTAGQARDARFALAFDMASDFSDMALTKITAGIDADDLTIHWLRPIPPIERARARLRMTEPDALEIETEGGRQRLDGPRGETTSNIALKGGKFRVTGLTAKDQISVIETDLAGPLAEILTLLRHPRLRLLDRSPVELRDPGGQVQGRISLNLPLESQVTMDDIRILAKARIEQARMAGVVAGRDLDQGSLDLEATNDGLKIAGRANVAAIPAQFTYELDFRAGAAGQVQQRASATGRAEMRQLAAAGFLDTGGFATGPGSFQLAFSQRRDGIGELRVNADLRETELAVPPLYWRKAAGTAATGEARLRLTKDRVAQIDDIQLTGEAIHLRARLEAVDGKLGLLHLDRVSLGRNQGKGTVTFQPSGRIVMAMSGETVDLVTRLTQSSTPDPRPGGREPGGREAPPGRPWSLDARFNTALVGQGGTFANVVLRGENDGTVMQRLRLEGRAGDGPFALDIVPDRGVRRLSATAGDAGALLRGLDVIHRMSGGQLSVTGTYDDRAPDRPLSGTAEITDFRIANAPALARLLQMMTLYGMLEMAQGPGLGFTRLVAPFRMTDAFLELRDARAFSPSIGVTVKGRIDRFRDQLELTGTIVPAHFFNSLLGDIPLIGRLFSPEAGGGLFAATYSLRGPANDPQISVNPLSALTPGFLRGLFSL